MPGIIESYVHTGNQIGVLVEINCLNKVTAATSEFRTLAKEIALQIAANPNIRYTKISDVPPSVVDRVNRQIKQKDEKLEIVRERIKEMCLYDTPYIRDDSITVEDLIKLSTTQLSEDITIARFVRFSIDESTNNNPPGDSGGIPSNPLPNSPTPLAEEAELE